MTPGHDWDGAPLLLNPSSISISGRHCLFFLLIYFTVSGKELTSLRHLCLSWCYHLRARSWYVSHKNRLRREGDALLTHAEVWGFGETRLNPWECCPLCRVWPQNDVQGVVQGEVQGGKPLPSGVLGVWFQSQTAYQVRALCVPASVSEEARKAEDTMSRRIRPSCWQ